MILKWVNGRKNARWAVKIRSWKLRLEQLSSEVSLIEFKIQLMRRAIWLMLRPKMSEPMGAGWELL